jgi:hypothetical protein
MAQDPTEQFQEQTRELLRAQQETFLASVKAWREAMSGADGVQPPPWPPSSGPLQAVPTPTEVAEAYYAFAAKLLADQSRFMEALSQAMAAPTKKGGETPPR